MMIADWVIVVAAVVSAVATGVSAVVAVLLGKIVVTEHREKARMMTLRAHSPVAGMGIPITLISIQDSPGIERALDRIAGALEGRNRR